MSRRQSRVSTDARQNDTLLEFENFKKKFLLANKHITKLNSTLSVRIEELNAQISTLYVENLRLRASEIALASQLKRERERSHKIMAEAEAAVRAPGMVARSDRSRGPGPKTHSLIKHFSHIRKSFNIPVGRSSSEELQPPPALRAKKPVVNPNQSPAPNRLARAPTIPGITEDDETDAIAEVDEDVEASPTPVRRKKAKPRTSDPYSVASIPSPLSPLPAAHDTPTLEFEEQLGKVGKRKPTRRQSGLLTTMTITKVTPDGITTDLVPPRPPSPAFGSPLRRSVGLEEEEEEAAAMNGEPVDPQLEEHEVEAILHSVMKRDKKEKKTKEKERDWGRDKDKERDRDSATDSGGMRETERKRSRVFDEPSAQESLQSTGKKSKLKDVTNSRVPSIFEAPIGPERQHTPEEEPRPIAESSRQATSRRFLATPEPTAQSSRPSQLPTPRSSSSPPPPPVSEAESAGGRERRVRKSINYAEPKLNTKMRKPDPAPPPPSAANRLSSGSSESVSPEARDTSPPLEDDVKTVRRKKSRVHDVLREDGEESEGTQADAEYSSLRWVNVDGRRRSVQSASLRRIEGDDVRRHSMAV